MRETDVSLLQAVAATLSVEFYVPGVKEIDGRWWAVVYKFTGKGKAAEEVERDGPFQTKDEAHDRMKAWGKYGADLRNIWQ